MTALGIALAVLVGLAMIVFPAWPDRRAWPGAPEEKRTP